MDIFGQQLQDQAAEARRLQSRNLILLTLRNMLYNRFIKRIDDEILTNQRQIDSFTAQVRADVNAYLRAGKPLNGNMPGVIVQVRTEWEYDDEKAEALAKARSDTADLLRLSRAALSKKLADGDVSWLDVTAKTVYDITVDLSKLGYHATEGEI